MNTWKDVARIVARHGIASNAPLEDEIARRGLTLRVTEFCDAMGDSWYRASLHRPDGQVVAEGRSPQRNGGRRLNRVNRRMAVLCALAIYLE
jgi:hypothetical protein